MNDDTRQQIALARYMLIAPILAEPTRAQNQYLRDLAGRTHDMPHVGQRHFSVSTFKGWLARYKRRGLAGLTPTPRADRGRHRRLAAPTHDAILVTCNAFPDLTRRMIYERLAKDDLLGQPPISYATLARFITANNLLPPEARTDLRKRFEAANTNDLWSADFMHGPKVDVNGKAATAILCAIIDDHSRVIVAFNFSASESIDTLARVLKQAILAHGVPHRLYVDNGSAFSCVLLLKACADLGIALIHSKPYDSPSRGKIERFFRTARERFLAGRADGLSLEQLNADFAAWLANDYHCRHHAGIDGRPIDRLHASLATVDVRRLSRAELDDIFLVRLQRTVNNDATISVDNKTYEVPSAYIRQRVDIRHPIDDPHDLSLFDKNIRVAHLKLVDVHENARTFRRKKAATVPRPRPGRAPCAVDPHARLLEVSDGRRPADVSDEGQATTKAPLSYAKKQVRR
jgi:putative transposase